MVRNRHFEEIDVGETTTTRGRTITEADVVNFAGVSGDFHPLHVDAAHAADSSFGQRIAHGLLVLSVAASLAMAYNEHAFFYGFDSIRFVNPTFLGDTISVETEVVETTERSAEFGTVVTHAEATKADGETVLAYDLVELVERESAAE
ncbi:MAG: MaoC/PaaZ C-terminal domain-containing protein [Halobacteriaceae archaeon]